MHASTEDDAPIRVENLRVSFAQRRTVTEAVKGVGFSLARGECLAIVGESGSGKSVTARALLGLVGPNAVVTADTISVGGRDMTDASEAEWRVVRGSQIGYVPQDALGALDPLRTVGAEVAEGLRNHGKHPRSEWAVRTVGLLEEADVPEARLRAGQYPHQLSGGLRQRALIAAARSAGPPVLIADEPTTALDLRVQGRVLDNLDRLRGTGVSLLLISHDLSAVARLADRIAVMHRGVFVEQGRVEDVLAHPGHTYTRTLIDSVPTARTRRERNPGAVPGPPGPPVLEAAGLTKTVAGTGGARRTVVDQVSFSLRGGEVLGVVGESGAGKSTTAHLAVGLEEPDEGVVTLLGKPWSGLSEARRRTSRHRVQLVQQDPLGAFDPRFRVERIVAEAFGRPTRRNVRAHRERVAELLESVRLPPELMGRYPAQLSGGQRQRVAIARALAVEPDVLVCDEPVSALDRTVQAQVVDLLARLSERLGLAVLFISHDLGVVRHLCDRVLVMKDGRVVEQGPTGRVFAEPEHPYTRELLAALPELPPRSTVPDCAWG